MGEFPYRGLPVLGCVLTLLTFGGSPDYALTSSVSLNMGGTSMSDPGQGYADAMTDLYIEPFLGVNVGPGDRHVVVTPEQLWPISCGEAALNDCIAFLRSAFRVAAAARSAASRAARSTIPSAPWRTVAKVL